MINDYLEIESGEVIDLSVQVDILGDKNETETEIVRTVIEKVIEYFSIDKRKMGDPLFVGDLMREVGNVTGVVNVVEIRVFNKIGGKYSSAEISQAYKDDITKEILQFDSTIYMKSNQICQIRFPQSDIKVRVKTLTSATY